MLNALGMIAEKIAIMCHDYTALAACKFQMC